MFARSVAFALMTEEQSLSTITSMRLAVPLALAAALALAPAVFAQTAAPAPASAIPAAVTPPVHPVEEKTLRAYFDEIHYVSWNRKLMAIGLDQQEKQIPPWTVKSIWEEAVDAVMAIDNVPVVLPVYQKYWSENLAQHVVKLFATPPGQKMVAQMFADSEKKIAAGDGAREAHKDAIAMQRAQEDANVRRAIAEITPQDQIEMAKFVRSPEWIRVQAMSAQINAECSAAIQHRQEEVFNEVFTKHRDELIAAKKTYEAGQAGK